MYLFWFVSGVPEIYYRPKTSPGWEKLNQSLRIMETKLMLSSLWASLLCLNHELPANQPAKKTLIMHNTATDISRLPAGGDSDNSTNEYQTVETIDRGTG